MIWMLAILAALLLWGVVIYNGLVRDRNRTLTAWSDIDVQLKRRYDLIPKLVAAVTQYARYEQATLSTLNELRSNAAALGEVKERGAAEGKLGASLKNLFALVEAYPELRA
ncbi:MAG: LemA family protein, partial [Desulfuromonadales bacterium]|nr:LemA family protein [Desulfuromonadales bacterium]